MTFIKIRNSWPSFPRVLYSGTNSCLSSYLIFLRSTNIWLAPNPRKLSTMHSKFLELTEMKIWDYYVMTVVSILPLTISFKFNLGHKSWADKIWCRIFLWHRPLNMMVDFEENQRKKRMQTLWLIYSISILKVEVLFSFSFSISVVIQWQPLVFFLFMSSGNLLNVYNFIIT